MPEIDELDDTLDEPAFPDEGDDRFKEMRKQANRASKLDRENQRLAKELAELKVGGAIAQAGLADLSGPQRVALLAAHGEQELSKDALLATARELGFAKPEADPAEDAARDEALDGVDRVRAASAGARPPQPAASIDERITQAQAAGDPKAVMALKAEAALRLLRSGRPVQLGD